MLAGAAKRSIAPDSAELAAGVYLGGFGSYRQRRATGVLDEPQCRAVAISDGTTAVVIAALDLVGAAGSMLDAIRAGAATQGAVAADRVLVACTHSHASPDAQGLWGGIPAAYAERVVAASVAAISESVERLADADARVATTSFSGLVRNRRDWPQTDTTLTTLRLLAKGGHPVATLANYACHPTAIGAGGTEVSRDWCGFAVDVLERELGGVAVYVNGAIGDVNPLFSGSLEHARTLGTSVAAWAIESLQDAEAADGPVAARVASLDLPVDAERLRQGVLAAVTLSGLEDADAFAALVNARDYGAASSALFEAGRGDLAQILAAVAGIEERAQSGEGGAVVRTQCGYVQLGALKAFAAPGEVLTRLALPLRVALPADHRMLLGLTQDTLGYFIPEDEWMRGRNGNYEESVSMGRTAGSRLAAALLSLRDSA